ncbi:uncharacterized protein LOC113345036 [Papaver somniferum]|uniref:uncharacterized protein LOC113345036 n=1 Tax=Papaver somniferum TaxID=3469 RepID=UPI000E702508|nr:uncharacterized protein LOC113345036 [Papaver somniferum]
MAEVAVRCELMGLQLKYIRFCLEMPSPNREFNLRITDMITITEMKLNSMMALSKLKNQQLSRQQLVKEVGVMEELNSEEGNSTNSTPISNLICDSNSQTPTPDDVGSQKFKSISRCIEEESLDFEMIPSFLFEEKEDSVDSEPQEEKSLTTRSNSIDVLHFPSEGVESKLIRDFISRNQGTIDGQYCLYLKEFFILDNKVNGMNYSYLHLDDVRSLFDRGKYVIVLSISYENLVNPWIPSLGYQSDFRCMPSIVSSCVTDAASIDERMLFVKLIDRIRPVLLLLGRTIEMEKVLEPQGIVPWTLLWSLYTGGVCFLIKMPVTDMSVQVIKCFNSAGNLVSFHGYFTCSSLQLLEIVLGFLEWNSSCNIHFLHL